MSPRDVFRDAAAHRLTLDGVRIRLDGVLLAAIDAEIGPGDVLTVMGPSGSGKSTLLGFLAGVLTGEFHVEGRIFVDGVDVTDLPPEERRIGLMFQEPLLFPHLSVRGNLLFGLPRRAPNRDAVADQALAEAGLDGFGPRDVATLSGGQASRVALLRVLLSAPRAMLLDEPFSRLDSHLRSDIRGYVFETLAARGLPAILVTHDAEDAEAAGGRIVRL